MATFCAFVKLIISLSRHCQRERQEDALYKPNGMPRARCRRYQSVRGLWIVNVAQRNCSHRWQRRNEHSPKAPRKGFKCKLWENNTRIFERFGYVTLQGYFTGLCVTSRFPVREKRSHLIYKSRVMPGPSTLRLQDNSVTKKAKRKQDITRHPKSITGGHEGTIASQIRFFFIPLLHLQPPLIEQCRRLRTASHGTKLAFRVLARPVPPCRLRPGPRRMGL